MSNIPLVILIIPVPVKLPLGMKSELMVVSATTAGETPGSRTLLTGVAVAKLETYFCRTE
jgi:hypothetical protein